MAEWRSMIESLGFQNARTFISTGNAVFETTRRGAGALEAELEDAFELRFGRRVHTIVRPAARFLRMAAGNPFAAESAADGSRVIVRVMRQPIAGDSVAALTRYAIMGERVKAVDGDLWVHFPGEVNRSRLMPVLGSKRLGAGTVRNWNTIRRLSEIVG